MFNEVDGAYRPYRAISVVPRKQHTTLARIPPFDVTTDELLEVLETDSEGRIVHMDFLWSAEWGICFKEVSDKFRTMTLFLVVIPRLIMSVVLYIMGARLLATTKQVENLLLITMALKFILDFDELLYQSFAPRRVKHLYKHLKGINVPRSTLQERAESRSSATLPVSKCCLLWVVLLVVWFLFAWPFYARIHAAWSIVCSGNVDFVIVDNNGNVRAQPEPAVPQGLTEQEQGILLFARPDVEPAGGWSPPADLMEALANEGNDRLLAQRAQQRGPQDSWGPAWAPPGQEAPPPVPVTEATAGPISAAGQRTLGRRLGSQRGPGEKP
jgi:hypothetical protein